MTKQIHVQLYPLEWTYWHGGIKKNWGSASVFIVNFDKIPHHFMEALRNIDIPLVSSLFAVTRFDTFSSYFIVEVGAMLPVAFTSTDQSTYK